MCDPEADLQPVRSPFSLKSQQIGSVSISHTWLSDFLWKRLTWTSPAETEHIPHHLFHLIAPSLSLCLSLILSISLSFSDGEKETPLNIQLWHQLLLIPSFLITFQLIAAAKDAGGTPAPFFLIQEVFLALSSSERRVEQRRWSQGLTMNDLLLWEPLFRIHPPCPL